jgi:hypothetical protein
MSWLVPYRESAASRAVGALVRRHGSWYARLPMVVEEGGPGTGGVRSNLGSSHQGNFPSSVLHSVRRCGVGNVIEREECEHIYKRNESPAVYLRFTFSLRSLDTMTRGKTWAQPCSLGAGTGDSQIADYYVLRLPGLPKPLARALPGQE